MNHIKARVFEQFKSGQISLFIVKRSGVEPAEITLNDIGFRKVGAYPAFFLWEHASEAEAFLLKGGGTSTFEVKDITIWQMVDLVEKLLGKGGLDHFQYELF